MKQNKIPLMLRLDEEIHKKLKYVSEDERRSLNSQVEHYIAEGLKEYEKIKGIISVHLENESQN